MWVGGSVMAGARVMIMVVVMVVPAIAPVHPLQSQQGHRWPLATGHQRCQRRLHPGPQPHHQIRLLNRQRLPWGERQLMRILVGLQQGRYRDAIVIKAAQHLGQRLHTGHHRLTPGGRAKQQQSC